MERVVIFHVDLRFEFHVPGFDQFNRNIAAHSKKKKYSSKNEFTSKREEKNANMRKKCTNEHQIEFILKRR